MEVRSWGWDWDRKFVPCQPEEALSGDVLLGLELVDNKLLQGGGLGRSLGVARVDFLGESSCQHRV